jgi:hypothetical protein
VTRDPACLLVDQVEIGDVDPAAETLLRDARNSPGATASTQALPFPVTDNTFNAGYPFT